MKQLFIFFFSVCVFPTITIASVGNVPERRVENVADGVIVTYFFKDPIIRPNHLCPGSFLWEYMGFGINDTSGEPAIPFRSDLFYIPNGFITQIDTIETIYHDTSFILSPSIPSLIKDGILESIDSITPYHGFFPNNIIEYGALDNYRGVGLQRITIIPIQYNYEQHIVRSYSKIKYKISFLQNTNITRIHEGNMYDVNKIKDFLSRVTLNYSSFPSLIPRETNIPENDVKNYLIITANNYIDSLQHFIEWKRIKGNRVFIESRNKGEWTTDSIKNIIDSIHGLCPLDYILMIGGFDDVPADSFVYYGGGKYCHGVTDYAYGLATPNLQIAQISRGRIPVDNPQELGIILNKIMRYERNPINNDVFYKTALHCGEFSDHNPNDTYEDDCAILTNENLHYHLSQNYNFQVNRSYYYLNYNFNLPDTTILHWNKSLYSYGQALPDSLQPQVFDWLSFYSILPKFDEGALYVLYVGHGSKNGWEAPVFTNQVASLQNGHKLPIVFSIACSTGKYDETGNCFVERILKKENGGCVGIFAPTEDCFPNFSTSMTYGMFDAIWPNLRNIYGVKNYDTEPYSSFENSFFELGKVLDLGLLRMAETSGLHDPYNRKEITEKLFHYFGDPSMTIYTDLPQNFDEPTIKYVNGKLCVQSSCDSTRISFYTPSVTSPIIDSFIGDSIEYETSADSVIICLDKHNYVPYVQTFHKNIYIQNETINDDRTYVGDNILIGNHVTTEKPSGNVIIENAKVTIQGNSVQLHPGTKITLSNVKINKK